ncbi:MAG: beta-lactamase family protein [Bryobacterales bacterium]|nr:beta-lactamase family protein [Bryobacterales bacterium]
MHRRLFLSSCAAGAGWPHAASAAPPANFVTDLSQWMEAAAVPGAWVARLERGRVAWQRGFGVRHADTKEPVDEQTVFEAASLTKQVTAHVAHQLHGEGKLDFDRPLSAYLGGDPGAGNLVTARHVLSHSSGWPNWRNKTGEALTPEFAPGERFRYSGEGYVYLSRVLEQVSGQPFGALVQSRVFDPLGMSGSSLYRREERELRIATGHDRGGRTHTLTYQQRLWAKIKAAGEPVEQWRYADAERALADGGVKPMPNYIVPNAAASLCTTGPDYARFVLQAMSRPSLREWGSTMRAGRGWRLGFGLGWGIEQIGARTFLWQWGDNRGYKNFVLVEPAAGSGLFVFTNGDGGMRVCDRVAARLTGLEHPAFLWLG